MEMNSNPIMIQCTNCGAPAEYDILQQKYCCAYCGSKVTTRAMLKAKKGWKEAKRLRSVKNAEALGERFYSCSGCGAKVIISKGEAVGKCDFCGGKVVRREYAEGDELPEIIIPFVLSRDEAMKQLESWCTKNAKRPEAEIIQQKKNNLTGYYLPYQIVKGETEGEVRTNSSSRHYACCTYLDEIAINTSRQIPNELLDAIEPFEWDKAQEFDFGILAGQRVKLQDIDEKELEKRTSEELTTDFKDILNPKFHTKGIETKIGLDTLLSLDAALPVYMADCGKVKIAINGQTGHVAVTKENVKNRDLSILEPIIITLLLFIIPFVWMYQSGESLKDSLQLAIMSMICFGLITFIAYFQRGSGAKKNVDTILRTPSVAAVRENGILHIVEVKELKKRPEPIILEKFKGTGMTPVDVSIYPKSRIIKWIFLFFIMNFLPIVLALLINGFDFARLEPANSIVWWCLSVPTTFILYLKFIRDEAFENPYFYYLKGAKKGKRVPRKEYLDYKKTNKKTVVKEILKVMICWPFNLIAAILLLVFVICVMMTAGIW